MENDMLPSSSPLYEPPSSPPPQVSRKQKKPPPITPKRFTRFFTPRTSSTRSRQGPGSRASRQLREVTQNTLNKRGKPRENQEKKRVLFEEDAVQSVEHAATPRVDSAKRRRAAPPTPPDSSPIQSTPSKRIKFTHVDNFDILEDEEEAQTDHEELPMLPEKPFPPRIRKVSAPHQVVMERSFGGPRAIARSRQRQPCIDWRSQTADFYTSPADYHNMGTSLPFSSASCNTNSMVAIGDEEGYIRLIETEKDSRPPFSKAHVIWRPHVSNAIMDVMFSSDDSLLATACGDQTAQIIDVQTQSTVFALCRHSSSVKQIRFQPGNDKIIATSSRDGSIQLWDLRCSGSGGRPRPSYGDAVTMASTYSSIHSAHVERVAPKPNIAALNLDNWKDSLAKGEVPSYRRGDISVTSLQFLPPGREHLMLTASDASTCVKLWDVRARHSRRGPPIAIASTSQPESHNKHRHFGITSLALSGDASRLYAISRDNTVYAYAASHLILGHAPELTTPPSRHKHNSTEKQGLGPLYGFRHPKFHATSFYVKASLRKAAGDKQEMLAVGSSDNNAVLFPTDEAFLKRPAPEEEDEDDDFSALPSSPIKPKMKRMTPGSTLAARMKDTVPIYEQGTPLVEAHEGEVTSVTWTQNGELITVSDDHSVRCWRGGPDARALRTSDKKDGGRWMSGWAGVDAGYDDDDA